MKKKTREKVIYIKSDKTLHARLQRVAEAGDKSMSQIAREAIVEKLESLERSARPAVETAVAYS